VKRRIMSLISKSTSSMDYDELERLDKESKKNARKAKM
jgi:hypothetical protein